VFFWGGMRKDTGTCGPSLVNYERERKTRATGEWPHIFNARV